MPDLATRVIKNVMIVDPNRLRLVIARVDAVQGTEPAKFEVSLSAEDASEIILVMDEAVLCKLADAISQYATP
jgi:hypothetical protein